TTGGASSDFCIYHGHRNLVWTYVKNMPPVLFYAFLPIHILMNLAIVLVMSIRGHRQIIVRSKLDAIRGLKAAWKQRRTIQKNRTQSSWQVFVAMAIFLAR